MKLQPAFVDWDRGNLPNHLTSVDLTYQDILFISGQSKAGEKVNGKERRWSPDAVKEYYSLLVKTIREQNTQSRHACGRQDRIEFPDLSLELVKAYKERSTLNPSRDSVPTTVTAQRVVGSNLSSMGEIAPSGGSDNEIDNKSDVS